MMKPAHRAGKDLVDKALGLPALHRPVNARVMDLRQTFCIPFDGQHLPLATGVQREQDVVEYLVQRKRRWRTTAAALQMGQDELLELRHAQFCWDRLPAAVSSHLPHPKIWTLADLVPPLQNPVPARLPDKFGFAKKLAMSWKEVEPRLFTHWRLIRVMAR